MGFWISLIASVVASWLTVAVVSSKSQSQRERETGTKINKNSNVAQIPIVYGERRVSGTRVFVATSGADNKYLYIILSLCEGEVNSIGSVYIDDVLSSDSKFSGLVSITKYVGTDTQAADSTFVNAGIGWTGNHRLKGVAYLAVRLKWDSEAFSSIPNIEAVVQGRKIYNGSTTAYSTNPAWCLRDYLTNARYGKGLPTSFINDTQFAAAATKCDALITPYSGGSQQKIFECNTILETDRPVLENAKILLSGFRGLMPYANGKYGVIVEDQGSSSFSFTESHIIGGLSIQGGTKKNRFNRVIASFVNPIANWQSDQIEYPPTGSAEEAEYLAADGVELEQRIKLETVTNVYMAQDIAEIALKRSRNGLACKFTATSEALNCSVGDIVDVSHSTPAWTAKTFRVNALSLRMDGTVSVELIEHQDSIYPWSTKTEADDIPDTNLPNPFLVASPLPTGVTEELYTTVNSKGTQSRAFFLWAAPNDAFVVSYEAEYKLNGASTYTFITNTSALEARVDDIPAGVYDFRVRSINSMGAKSDYSYLNNKTISGLTAVPPDVANFSIRALDGQCHLSWSKVNVLDVTNGGSLIIRHSSLVANATWQDGQEIGEAIAGSATFAVLPLLTGTYMIKAVDSGGRFSTNAKYATTTVPNILDFNAVVAATEHPNFTGTRSDMIVDSNVLKLDGAPRYLLSEANDFLIAENGDRLAREIGDIGVIEDSGSYYFANSVDLGSTYTSRLTANLTSSVSVASDLIDYRTQNIDSWQNFDGASSDAITAILELRSTTDNPASNPTWSDWSPFLVGDYHARAYEFRVMVTNTDSSYNISITALSVSVDMPDRVEKASDLSVSASSTAVSFGSNFKAVPVIGVTMQDANSGDYFRVTSKARTGFTVQCFNSSNTGIVRSINWQAVGYGKEAA